MALIAFMVALGGFTHAHPLALEYSITDTGTALYDYDFDLILDNHDGSWATGQGWSWIVFGDAQSSDSPLSDFELDTADLPVGPFDDLNYSSGYHNGPTWLTSGGSSNVYWVPNAVGSKLSWSGTSEADLGQGQLLYSALWAQDGALLPSFETATLKARVRVNPIPEPCSLLLFGAALAGAGAAQWRRRRG
jgi:hypothetical protein